MINVMTQMVVENKNYWNIFLIFQYYYWSRRK